MAYYFSGFGPAPQQLLACLVWLPLQLAALIVYPAFKVCAAHTVSPRYVLHALCLQGAFLLLSQVWEFLRPGAPLVTDITFIILTIVYNLMAHTVVVSSIVTFNFFPVPAAVLSVEQVSRYPQSSLSETSVCPVCPVCLSFQ